VRLEIEALAAGGRGVGRKGGTVWFVSRTVPGDVVLAAARRTRKSYVEGEVVELLLPSPLRREAPCEYQTRCGGCPWMVLDEGEQGKWKQRSVLDALQRIGRVAEPPLAQILAPGSPTGYRNRVEFSLGADRSGELVLGLHSGTAPGCLVDIRSCTVQHASANEVLATVRRVLLRPPRVPVGSRRPGEGFRVVLRRSWSTGRILVVLREPAGRFPRSAELARELVASHPEVCGVVRLQARAGRRGGTRALALAGQTRLEEAVAGHAFRLPAATFVQVNNAAAAELVRLVVEGAGPPDGARVLDLYGGVGVHGLALLARGAAAVAVCDADAGAIACGRAAAREGGSGRIRYHHADVGAFLRRRPPRPDGCDLVIANPPRTGLGPGVAEAILDRRPARIVLVSCDPATLARDLRALIRGGASLERVVPVDMFPQTAHVEAVASLSVPRAR